MVRYFSAEKDPLTAYEWDQKKEGTDFTLKLALAHGVEGKALISATMDLPKDAKGSLVTLSNFDAFSKSLDASAMKLWKKTTGGQSSSAATETSPCLSSSCNLAFPFDLVLAL